MNWFLVIQIFIGSGWANVHVQQQEFAEYSECQKVMKRVVESVVLTSEVERLRAGCVKLKPA